jgi:VanZ like family
MPSRSSTMNPPEHNRSEVPGRRGLTARGRVMLALIVSATVVLTSPFVADLRDSLRRLTGARYGLTINLLVVGAVVLACAAALARIRDRRLLRYGAIAAALAAGIAYIWVNALPAIERFHFVEYGIVTMLFYRAVVPRESAAAAVSDVSIFLVPVFAALIVGTADEWVQWFVPRRYGEVRDILLNGAAIACGLLFSLGVDPPGAFRLRPSGRSLALVSRLAAATVLALGAFLLAVHLGYTIDDGEVGRFRSRHTAEELAAASRDRLQRWTEGALPPAPTLSREDQYLTEGLWHVQARNDAWTSDVDTAWNENLILEKYFAPVLRAGQAWPAAQRADAAARHRADSGRRFESHAARYPILTWNKPLFAALVAGLAACLLAPNFTSGRKC